MHTISFKHVLEQNKEGPQQHHDLFTKLKQNLEQQSASGSGYGGGFGVEDLGEGWYQLGDVMRRCQLELEVLKLEKANQVANRFMETGVCLTQIMEEMSAEIQSQISQIIKTKYQVTQKPSKHLQSTFHNTNSNSLKEPTPKNSAVKNNHTPKIVEFTLGNRQGSSAKSSNQITGRDEEVSQFFVNSKGLVTRNIREKVMGRKLK